MRLLESCQIRLQILCEKFFLLWLVADYNSAKAGRDSFAYDFDVEAKKVVAIRLGSWSEKIMETEDRIRRLEEMIG